MTSWTGSYQPGRPYAICDRCGLRYRLDQLSVEWSNAKVCEGCHDPRPVHLTTPYLSPGEGAPIPGSRPDVIQQATDASLQFPFRDGTVFEPPE